MANRWRPAGDDPSEQHPAPTGVLIPFRSQIWQVDLLVKKSGLLDEIPFAWIIGVTGILIFIWFLVNSLLRRLGHGGLMDSLILGSTIICSFGTAFFVRRQPRLICGHVRETLLSLLAVVIGGALPPLSRGVTLSVLYLAAGLLTLSLPSWLSLCSYSATLSVAFLAELVASSTFFLSCSKQ